MVTNSSKKSCKTLLGYGKDVNFLETVQLFIGDGILWSRFFNKKLQIESINGDLETIWKPKKGVLAKNVFFDFFRR